MLLHTLEGFQDVHAEAAWHHRKIQEKITDVFYHYGYHMVTTPLVEPYLMYHHSNHIDEKNKLFKLIDSDGSIIALRPDFTPSIARYAATYLTERRPYLKVAYAGNVYQHSRPGEFRERAQVGVECIGMTGKAIEIELLLMALRSLLSVGLKGFRLELGHAAFFKTLIQLTGIDDCVVSSEIYEAINHKNTLGLQLLLSRLNISPQLKEVIVQLPTLFGDVSVLQRAEDLLDTIPDNSLVDKAKMSLTNLREIHHLLAKDQLEHYISFDLCSAGESQYYSGLIFRGYAYGSGHPILNGGRYDDLLEQFGTKKPAIGFAILVDELIDVLFRQDRAISCPPQPALLVYPLNDSLTALYLAEGLRRQGQAITLVDEEMLSVKAMTNNNEGREEVIIKEVINQRLKEKQSVYRLKAGQLAKYYLTDNSQTDYQIVEIEQMIVDGRLLSEEIKVDVPLESEG